MRTYRWINFQMAGQIMNKCVGNFLKTADVMKAWKVKNVVRFILWLMSSIFPEYPFFSSDEEKSLFLRSNFIVSNLNESEWRQQAISCHYGWKMLKGKDSRKKGILLRPLYPDRLLRWKGKIEGFLNAFTFFSHYFSTGNSSIN